MIIYHGSNNVEVWKTIGNGYTTPRDEDTNLEIDVLNMNSEQTSAYSSNCTTMNIFTYVLCGIQQGFILCIRKIYVGQVRKLV